MERCKTEHTCEGTGGVSVDTQARAWHSDRPRPLTKMLADAQLLRQDSGCRSGPLGMCAPHSPA